MTEGLSTSASTYSIDIVTNSTERYRVRFGLFKWHFFIASKHGFLVQRKTWWGWKSLAVFDNAERAADFCRTLAYVENS